MHENKRNTNDRVGMFLNPHTRNRLNKLKAELTLQTGISYSQNDIIVILLDHYAETSPKPKAAEYAR